MDEKKTRTKTQVPIDLGLSALMRESVSADVVGDSSDPKNPNSKTSTKLKQDLQLAHGIETTKDQTLKELIQNCLVFEQQKSWQELSSYAEKQMSLSGVAQIPAKIFWVKAELQLNQVPASVLAGPLESATKELLNPQALSADQDSYIKVVNESVEVLQTLAAKLRERGSHDLALTLLERCYALDPTEAPNFAAGLKDEIDRILNNPKLKLDPKQQVKIQKYKGILAGLKVQESRIVVPETNVSAVVARRGTKTDLRKDYKKDIANEKKYYTKQQRVWPYAVMLSLLLFGVYLYEPLKSAFQARFLPKESLVLSAFEKTIDPVSELALEFPKIERITNHGQLAALLGDIEKIPLPERQISQVSPPKANFPNNISSPLVVPVRERTAPKDSGAKQDTRDASVNDSFVNGELKQNSKQDKPEKNTGEKNSVDTSGPLESREVERISQLPPEEPRKENLPSVMDFPPYRNGSRGDAPRDSRYDNRAPEPRLESRLDSRDDSRDRSRSSGASLPHVSESDSFSEGRIFTAVSRTKIMRSASYYAESIGVLESGDRVLVTSRDGSWLKLKSRKGQSGYVLAQDLEEGTL